jgi:Xaa-Pro aminopeptidase
VHDVALGKLVEGLIELELLPAGVEANIESGAYRSYYMHRTSHWLGLDVHDVGAYYTADRKSRALEPGMVLTVEPGLYVSADDERAPGRFRGLGVRIEDDVLVTPAGHDVLTAAIPKTVADVEALR